MHELPVDRLREVAGDSGFTPGGTLPDGCVEPAGAACWQRFLDMLDSSGWRVLVADRESDRPLLVAEVVIPDDPITLKIWPGSGTIQINVFANSEESILFDFDLREMLDQVAADDLADFVRRTGQATGRQVSLSLEGNFDAVFGTYDPASDTFALT